MNRREAERLWMDPTGEQCARCFWCQNRYHVSDLVKADDVLMCRSCAEDEERISAESLPLPFTGDAHQ